MDFKATLSCDTSLIVYVSSAPRFVQEAVQPYLSISLFKDLKVLCVANLEKHNEIKSKLLMTKKVACA